MGDLVCKAFHGRLVVVLTLPSLIFVHVQPASTVDMKSRESARTLSAMPPVPYHCSSGEHDRYRKSNLPQQVLSSTKVIVSSSAQDQGCIREDC
jgi:hypothetical protein